MLAPVIILLIEAVFTSTDSSKFLLGLHLAAQVNTELCDKFSVGRYPMLLWGPPHKFTSSGWAPKQEKNEIKDIDDAKTAERLLNWINKRIGRQVIIFSFLSFSPIFLFCSVHMNVVILTLSSDFYNHLLVILLYLLVLQTIVLPTIFHCL